MSGAAGLRVHVSGASGPVDRGKTAAGKGDEVVSARVTACRQRHTTAGAGAGVDAVFGAAHQRPGLLHNMSARPRTEVAFEVRPVDPGGVARFRLPEGLSLTATVAETSEAALDAAWVGYGLTGAALVFPWSARHAVVYDRAVTATDRVLVLNVLARARAAVLLGSAPAVLDSEYLRRDLACDDPRLVALVEATGATRIRGRS